MAARARAGVQKLIAFISIILISLTTIGWTICLVLPYGWHLRKSLVYTIDIGLYKVSLGFGVVGDAAIFILRQAGLKKDLMDAIESLNDFEDTTFNVAARMCTLPNILVDFCGIWTQLRLASIAMLILGCGGIILHILGAVFLYQYWNVKAKAITRKWTFGFLAIAPGMYSIAEIQYAFLTMGLNEFPPRDSDTTWGPCLIFTMLLTVVSWVPFLLSAVAAKKSPDEDLQEAQKNLKEATLDHAIEMRGINMQLNADQQYGYDDYNQQYGTTLDYNQQYGGAVQHPPSWGTVPMPQSMNSGYPGAYQQPQMPVHDPWRQPYS